MTEKEQMERLNKKGMKHTEEIQILLKAGKIKEAMEKHNQNIKKEFKRAEKGEMINLTDLMASKEEITFRERR